MNSSAEEMKNNQTFSNNHSLSGFGKSIRSLWQQTWEKHASFHIDHKFVLPCKIDAYTLLYQQKNQQKSR